MASLHIRDSETADLVTRVAKRSGLTAAALVRELALAREAELDSRPARRSARETIQEFWREHPMPPPTGFVADKAFFDELSGDL